MTRYRSILLHFVVIYGLGAALASAQKPPAQPAPTAPDVKFVPWTGDLDGMLQRRTIRVLVAYSKTQYYVVRGVQRGTSYEQLKAFEDYLNVKYPQKTKSLRLHVVFIPVPRGKLLSHLADGTGDIAVAGLTITPEREAIADFSDYVIHNVSEIAVTGPESPSISTLDDLSGKVVYLRKSSSYWTHLQHLNERFRKEGKPPAKVRELPEDLEDEDVLEMVNAGLLSITIVDDFVARLWSKLFTRLQLHPEIVVNTGGEFGWALRKNTPKLMAAANDFLKTHREGTAFGNTVWRKYTVNTQAIRSATSATEIKKFENTAQLFRKYSSQYDLDYLLMMAQGFQESGLDQAAKSKVGAIGIMQLMPATGAQRKVGDIHQIDPNIHGGVKYIRFMVDQYFANEPMDNLNKILFAFAAYNAGPGRIHQLRQEAEKRGFDPNIWTDNVEMIAAARIGVETVTYVSNIYKYYIAYKLADAEQQERQKAKEALEKGPE